MVMLTTPKQATFLRQQVIVGVSHEYWSDNALYKVLCGFWLWVSASEVSRKRRHRMIEEGCVAWEPIPEMPNEYWNVDVVHMEELSPPNAIGGLAVIIAAQWQTVGPELGWIRKAWRVRFLGCRAYRMRTIGFSGNPSLTRPDQRKATWEVSPSNYLIEDGVPDGWVSGVAESVLRYHHFVMLTSGNVVCEVVGGTWMRESVGHEWAHPFLQVPQ